MQRDPQLWGMSREQIKLQYHKPEDLILAPLLLKGLEDHHHLHGDPVRQFLDAMTVPDRLPEEARSTGAGSPSNSSELEEAKSKKMAYMMEEGLLMRRWISDACEESDSFAIYQVVVPTAYRSQEPRGLTTNFIYHTKSLNRLGGRVCLLGRGAGVRGTGGAGSGPGGEKGKKVGGTQSLTGGCCSDHRGTWLGVWRGRLWTTSPGFLVHLHPVDNFPHPLQYSAGTNRLAVKLWAPAFFSLGAIDLDQLPGPEVLPSCPGIIVPFLSHTSTLLLITGKGVSGIKVVLKSPGIPRPWRSVKGIRRLTKRQNGRGVKLSP
ncbi:hypothetical protein NQZ68_022215 [Dissostichus eleginoides]|nr:hypothetical protein NQZ68_022215 [Dissostichus eleginoides]